MSRPEQLARDMADAKEFQAPQPKDIKRRARAFFMHAPTLCSTS